MSFFVNDMFMILFNNYDVWLIKLKYLMLFVLGNLRGLGIGLRIL